MIDDSVSFAASERCPRCDSTNWLIDEDYGMRLDARHPTRPGDRACNDCGSTWPPPGDRIVSRRRMHR
jgi:hypothetical protein